MCDCLPSPHLSWAAPGRATSAAESRADPEAWGRCNTGLSAARKSDTLHSPQCKEGPKTQETYEQVTRWLAAVLSAAKAKTEQTKNYEPHPTAPPSRTASPGSLWVPGGRLCLHKMQKSVCTAEDNLETAWWTLAMTSTVFFVPAVRRWS